MEYEKSLPVTSGELEGAARPQSVEQAMIWPRNLRLEKQVKKREFYWKVSRAEPWYLVLQRA